MDKLLKKKLKNAEKKAVFVTLKSLLEEYNLLKKSRGKIYAMDRLLTAITEQMIEDHKIK
ncbi:MAG: hypothetical protein PHX21_13035 [bacterium]|nr:hypothetical protein [bacterium]